MFEMNLLICVDDMCNAFDEDDPCFVYSCLVAPPLFSAPAAASVSCFLLCQSMKVRSLVRLSH